MDRNGDGFLNIAEFREAMDTLGDHLDGPTVAEVCNALDIDGKMDYDQLEVRCSPGAADCAACATASCHQSLCFMCIVVQTGS
jgi:hypothetical protein